MNVIGEKNKPIWSADLGDGDYQNPILIPEQFLDDDKRAASDKLPFYLFLLWFPIVPAAKDFFHC
jgi:hypothetical protein